MSQYDNLKATIALNVYENHNNQVTANMVKAAMNAMTDSLGAGYQYLGIATPNTAPGTPDQKVFYIAAQPGDYTNFGTGITVNDGEVAILKYDTAWHKEVTGAATAAQVTELGQEVIYDVSVNNGGATFASLSALLSSENLSTLIPTAVRCGGMSIRFVQTSDNKYVQFRLTKDEWSTYISDWVEADSNKVDSKVFYVTDGNGYVIVKIDKDGVHSVDFRIGNNGDSVAEAINGISGQISSAVNAEKLLREQGDTIVTGLVEAEEARAKAVEDTKLNYTIIDDKFCITDANDYIICQIDANGVHSVNIDENPNIIDDNRLTITDNNGYIICKIDANGVHSAKDKHAVACMVLSEAYYPTSAPTRDGDGNVTYVEVMFETGIAGSISITYTNGNSSSVAVVYGDYNYTITINRDVDGNVETVLVN